MHWRSQVQSPKEKNKSLLMNYSRISQRSTDANRSYKAFQPIEIDSSFTQTIDKPMSYMKMASTPIRNKIIEKKIRNINRNDEVKRNYLSKVLINQMLNTRLAFKQFQTLPIKIFKKGQTFHIARQIVFKTKLNIETSILRTLIVAEERKHAISNTKFHLQSGFNIFITPSQPKSHQSHSKTAILKLAELIKLPVKDAAQQFSKHRQQVLIKIKYFNKLCANYSFSKKLAFLMFKVLPNYRATGKQAKTQLKNKQLKIIWNILINNYGRIMGRSLTYMKLCSWNIKFRQQLIAKQMISFARLRVEQCLAVWKRELMKKRMNEGLLAEISQQKRNALRRIVARNYLKLWRYIGKRKGLFMKVARRIGCFSKINEQKSLWRLIEHASLAK